MAFPFAKYSLRSVVRSSRRTLFSIIGVVLAVSLVSGEGVTIDTLLGYIVQGRLDTVPYDFLGEGAVLPPTEQEVDSVLTEISSVSGVERAAPMVHMSATLTNTSGPWNASALYSEVGGVDTRLLAMRDRLGLQGEVVISPGEVTLFREAADRLDLSVGERLRVSVTGEGGVNASRDYTVGAIVDVDPEKRFEMGPMFGALMETAEVVSLHGMVDASGLPLFVFVWVDRSTIIEPSDASATEYNLKRLEHRLDSAGQPHGMDFHYNQGIVVNVDMISAFLLIIRLIFIALSLPVIVLGVYLGVLGADLSHAERRREIAILKSRGASASHTFSLLMCESITLGILSGLIGLLMGLLVSRFILQMFGAGTVMLEFQVSLLTAAIAIVFAIVLIVIANYRPARRASSIAITEGLHAFSTEESRIEYRPRTDIIFVSVAVATYILMLLYVDYITKGSGPLSGVLIALLCIGVILVILVPLSPLFLIVGVTRLATRSSPRVYEAVSRVVRPFTRELWPLVRKNLARNPRRASSVCLLISLALAFGLFVSVTFDSQRVFEERSVRAYLGGDIRVASTNHQADVATLGHETDIPGVVSWTPVWASSVSVSTVGPVAAISFDAERYPLIAQPDPAAFISGSTSAFAEAASGNGVLVSRAFAESHAYATGDALHMVFPTSGRTVDLRISAVVKFLPGVGMGPQGLIGDAGTIFLDYGVVPLVDRGPASLELFDVDDASISQAAEHIRTTYGASVDVAVYPEEVEHVRDDPIAGSMYGFLNLEYAFALAVIGIGLGMIMFMAMIERRQEVANMLARGASVRNVMALVSGEGVTISLVGMVIGTGTGLATAYVFNTLFGMGSYQNSIVPRDVVVSWNSLLVVLVTLGVLMLSSLLTVIPLRRVNLNEILRWRGG